MKKFFLFGFGLAFIISQLVAQVPQCINYQTVVRSSSGQLVKDQAVSLKFSIHQNSVSGQEVYSEKHGKTTNQFGIVNLHIGKGSVLSGNFETIDWGAGKMFLKTFLDLSGGDSFTEMGTAEMVSVPYALHAGSIYVNYSNETLYIGDQAIYLPSGNGGNTGNTISDVDGNSYKIVLIGNQWWMAENLKTTKYNDGTSIPLKTDDDSWKTTNQDSPAYCWYNNNISNKNPYGALYNFYAVSTETNGGKNLCPDGWKVPTNEDWTALTDYLGGLSEAGGKMKAAGTEYWQTPNTGATNESGFNALPGGSRVNADFIEIGTRGRWWSSTKHATFGSVYFWQLSSGHKSVYNHHLSKNNGFSIRCIKD